MRMNSHQRVLATLNHREPDRAPRDLGSTTATGIHPVAYDRLKRHLGLSTPSELLSARAQLAIVEHGIIERFGLDLLPLIPASAADVPEMDDERTYVDRWGVQRQLPKEGGHYYILHPPLADAMCLGDLSSYPWPEPETDYSILGDTARHVRQTTDKALVLNLAVGFIHQTQFLRGYEAWLMDLALDPIFAGALMDRVLEIQLAEAMAMLRAVGDAADVVIYADDIAFQNGLMVSPEVYRRRLRPRQARFFDLLASSGLKVLYHSCGNILPLLGDLIDMGVAAVNPVQVSAGPMGDTAALNREWGDRLTFWGGIDTHRVLPRGTPADVRVEVHLRLNDLSPGGGYVLAAVHDIQAEVPPENVCAMFDAATECDHT